MKQSTLYTEYPSKESNLVRQGMASGEKCWKGCFEDLILYYGIGFDCSWTVGGLIEMEKGKGIFSWDKTVIDSLAGSTKLGDTMSLCRPVMPSISTVPGWMCPEHLSFAILGDSFVFHTARYWNVGS
jgi:hypothetical protein